MLLLSYTLRHVTYIAVIITGLVAESLPFKVDLAESF